MCISDVKTYKELKTLKLEPEIYLQQISENEYQATVDYDVIMIEIYATAKHCSCAISFGDWFKSQRYFFFKFLSATEGERDVFTIVLLSCLIKYLWNLFQ